MEALCYEKLLWQNRIVHQGFKIMLEWNCQKYFGKLYKVYVVHSLSTVTKKYLIIAVDVYEEITELEGTKLIEFNEDKFQQMYFTLSPAHNNAAVIVQLLHSFENKINLWI